MLKKFVVMTYLLISAANKEQRRTRASGTKVLYTVNGSYVQTEIPHKNGLSNLTAEMRQFFQ